MSALRTAGIEIWRVPEARVMHPPPNGWGHFVRRALGRGHDRALLWDPEFAAAPNRKTLFRLVLTDTWSSVTRIVRHHREVGLRPLQVPAALSIAFSYYGLSWLGYAITKLRPDLIPRHLPM